MRWYSTLFAVLPITVLAAPIIPSSDQTPLRPFDRTRPLLPVDVWSAGVKHGKVQGANEAFYCHAPRSKQLFSLDKLDITPTPTEINDRFSLSLRGSMPEVAGLEDSSLTVEVSRNNKDEPLALTGRLADLAQLRQNHEHANTIRPGLVELIADGLPRSKIVLSGMHTVRLHAKVPDGRTLFCFESLVDLKMEGQ